MARLELDQIFSDNMVLPAKQAFLVAGMTDSQTTVRVQIDQQQCQTISDENGRWQCEFEGDFDVHQQYEIFVRAKNQELTIKGVRFGRVILVAGQSNIGFRMLHDHDFKSEKAQLNLDNVYFYNVPQPSFSYEDGQLQTFQSKSTKWHCLNPNNLEHMSAMGFYAVQQVAKAYPDLPIGLVCCTKDGTTASTWLSNDSLNSQSILKKRLLNPFESQLQGTSELEITQLQADFKQATLAHNKKMYTYIKEHPEVPLGEVLKIMGTSPWPPPVTPDSYLRPSAMYKTMMTALQHYTVDQAVWYQGETDVEDADIYDVVLEALVREWRRILRNDALEIWIIQLPKYQKVTKNRWALLRQQQLKVTAKMEGVHLVSIADTGEVDNPHPVAKKQPGHRLGQCLLGMPYQQTPMPKDLKQVDGTWTLTFNDVKDIIVQGSVDMEVKVDEQWQNIKATVVNNQLQFKAPKQATAVRYGYDNVPELTMFNEVGYPVTPFVMSLENNQLI